MSWVSLWFIRSSLIYFALATALGILMAVTPQNTEHIRFIHVHLNLLGWMSMTIFGVGYHIFPRFSGRPLWSENLATVQFWTAQAGLAGMVLSYPFMDSFGLLFVIFAIIEWISILLFLINMLKTIRGIE